MIRDVLVERTWNGEPFCWTIYRGPWQQHYRVTREAGGLRLCRIGPFLFTLEPRPWSARKILLKLAREFRAQGLSIPWLKPQ